MIVNETDSGKICSRYDAELLLIEMNVDGRRVYMRRHQAVELKNTLTRLIAALIEDSL
jgi:hypothetical protein